MHPPIYPPGDTITRSPSHIYTSPISLSIHTHAYTPAHAFYPRVTHTIVPELNSGFTTTIITTTTTTTITTTTSGNLAESRTPSPHCAPGAREYTARSVARNEVRRGATTTTGEDGRDRYSVGGCAEVRWAAAAASRAVGCIGEQSRAHFLSLSHRSPFVDLLSLLFTPFSSLSCLPSSFFFFSSSTRFFPCW